MNDLDLAPVLTHLAALAKKGEPVRIAVCSKNISAVLSVSAVKELAADDPDALPELTDTQDSILEVLRTADKPMKLMAVLRRMGYAKRSTYLSTMMKGLIARGLVERVDSHFYRLAT